MSSAVACATRYATLPVYLSCTSRSALGAHGSPPRKNGHVCAPGRSSSLQANTSGPLRCAVRQLESCSPNAFLSKGVGSCAAFAGTHAVSMLSLHVDTARKPYADAQLSSHSVHAAHAALAELIRSMAQPCALAANTLLLSKGAACLKLLCVLQEALVILSALGIAEQHNFRLTQQSASVKTANSMHHNFIHCLLPFLTLQILPSWRCAQPHKGRSTNTCMHYITTSKSACLNPIRPALVCCATVRR